MVSRPRRRRPAAGADARPARWRRRRSRRAVAALEAVVFEERRCTGDSVTDRARSRRLRVTLDGADALAGESVRAGDAGAHSRSAIVAVDDDRAGAADALAAAQARAGEVQRTRAGSRCIVSPSGTSSGPRSSLARSARLEQAAARPVDAHASACADLLGRHRQLGEAMADGVGDPVDDGGTTAIMTTSRHALGRVAVGQRRQHLAASAATPPHRRRAAGGSGGSSRCRCRARPRTAAGTRAGRGRCHRQPALELAGDQLRHDRVAALQDRVMVEQLDLAAGGVDRELGQRADRAVVGRPRRCFAARAGRTRAARRGRGSRRGRAPWPPPRRRRSEREAVDRQAPVGPSISNSASAHCQRLKVCTTAPVTSAQSLRLRRHRASGSGSRPAAVSWPSTQRASSRAPPAAPPGRRRGRGSRSPARPATARAEDHAAPPRACRARSSRRSCWRWMGEH